MKLWIGEDAQAVAERAADLIEDVIKRKPDCVLGLATGSTPLQTYQELIERYRAGKTDYSRVRTFNLDEYYGLSPDHPQSYYYYMHHNLFQHLNIQKENTHIPDGLAEDTTASCTEYEQMIADSGGIDLQLLGIGNNGHIGFNEPADQLQPHTHLTELSETTIKANARFFSSDEEVPRHALTMGMSTIMSARKIVLLAVGEAKADIIKKLFDVGITTQLPASLLKLHHDATILVDQAAARDLAPLVGRTRSR